jgi:hypothetical protein
VLFVSRKRWIGRSCECMPIHRPYFPSMIVSDPRSCPNLLHRLSPCQHAFCYSCIQSWGKSCRERSMVSREDGIDELTTSCPTCRSTDAKIVGGFRFLFVRLLCTG